MPETDALVGPEDLTVSSSDEVRKYLEEKHWWLSVLQRDVRSTDMLEGDLRVDADFHTSAAAEARRLLASLGPEAQALTDLADIWTLARFKRVYTEDSSKGWPYLSAEESFSFRPYSKGFLAKKYTPKDRDKHFAKEGWLLMSTSGSVGELQFVTPMLEPYFLTHDLARIIPRSEVPDGIKRPIPAGYLCACLSTSILRSLLIPYGAVVRHLEASHLEGLPIPRLEEDQERRIHSMVKKAWELRDEANRLLDEATQTSEQLIKNKAAKKKVQGSSKA
jgi:type I restriction enzyme, S subunit